jgi:hypothetical protein
VDYPAIYGELKPNIVLAAGIFTEKEKEETGQIQPVWPEHCWAGPDRWLNTREAANLTSLGWAGQSRHAREEGVHAAIGIRSNGRGRFLPYQTLERRRRELDDDGEDWEAHLGARGRGRLGGDAADAWEGLMVMSTCRGGLLDVDEDKTAPQRWPA